MSYSIFTMIFGIIQIISITINLIYDYKKNSTAMFLWASLIIFFGMPHLFSSIVQKGVYSSDTLLLASIFVTLFNIIYDYRIEKNSNTFEKRFLRNTILIFFIMFIVTYIAMGGFKNSSWGKYFSFYDNGYFNFFLYFTYFHYALTGVSLVLYLKKKYFMAIMTMLIMLSIALLTNTKMMFLPIIFSLIFPIAFSKNKKITFKLIFIGFIGIVMSLYLINFAYLLRTYSNLHNLLNNLSLKEINQIFMDSMYNSEGELGLRNAFYMFIERKNSFPDFNKGHTYIRMIMVFIPEGISFDLKPFDFTVTMGSAFIGDYTNKIYSMHPTFYGDSFANFNFFGIFIALFWGFFSNIIDNIIKNNNDFRSILLTISISTAFVMIGRGSVYNSFFTIIMNFFIIFLVSQISKIVILNRKSVIENENIN